MGREKKEKMEEGEDAEEEEEEKWSRSTWPGETTSSKGSHRWRRWRVVVYLPNIGTQNIFIITELCFHSQGIFGTENLQQKNWHPTLI